MQFFMNNSDFITTWWSIIKLPNCYLGKKKVFLKNLSLFCFQILNVCSVIHLLGKWLHIGSLSNTDHSSAMDYTGFRCQSSFMTDLNSCRNFSCSAANFQHSILMCGVFPHTSSNYWTPAGCSTSQVNSDTVYLETASDPQVKSSILQGCKPSHLPRQIPVSSPGDHLYFWPTSYRLEVTTNPPWV